MADRDTLLRLAERVEAASGADRELDLSIHRHIDPKHEAYMDADLAEGMAQLIARGGDAWEQRKEALFRSANRSPRYTGSLDAALTLVPEGWVAWEISSRRKLAEFAAQISRLANGMKAQWEHAQGRAATPPLALTAAALRARAEGTNDAPR